MVDMCDDCAAQKGKGRHGEPHPNLERVGKRREAAFGGMRADEQDYRCTACGQQWMHETGNHGVGWMASSA